MGAVGAAALLGGLVDLDVLDNEVAGVKALGVGVGLGVLEQTQEELGRLDGPAGARDAELLAYWGKNRLSASRLRQDARPSPRNQSVSGAGVVFQTLVPPLFTGLGFVRSIESSSYLGRSGRWSQRSGGKERPPSSQ